MCCNLVLFRMLVVFVHPVHNWVVAGIHGQLLLLAKGALGEWRMNAGGAFGETSPPSSSELAYMSTCCPEVQQQQRTHGQDKLSVVLLNTCFG
jgi:hypothetical protein